MNGRALIEQTLLEEEGEILDNKDYIFYIRGRELKKSPHIHFKSKEEPNSSAKLKPGNPYDGCISLSYYGYFDHHPHFGRLPRKDWKFIVENLGNNDFFKFVLNEWNRWNQNYTVSIPEDKNELAKLNPYYNK